MVKQLLNTQGLVGVVYGRVSTDEQTENFSLDTQVSHSEQLAQRLGISLPHAALLDDFTGTSIDRPQLNVLREMIRQRKINALILNTSDRLSRKPSHGEQLLDEFARYGVRLFIVYHNRELDITEDSPDRDLLLQEMIFNRRWRVMLLEAMQRGKKGKAAKGLYIGAGYAPLGYYKERQGRITTLHIHNEEAEIVRNIYRWYVDEGVGVSEIQRRLHGTATPLERKPELDQSKLTLVKTMRKSGDWSMNTIYHILRNEAYTGRLTQHEDSTQPVAIEIPAIIERRTWEKAQALLATGQARSKRNTKHEYLMQSRLRCSECTYTLAMEPTWIKDRCYRYYLCPSCKNHTPRPQCGLSRIRQDMLDEVVWRFISNLVRHPKTLAARLLEAQQELEPRNDFLHERLKQIEATKQRQENKLDLLLEDYADTRNEQVRTMFRRLKDETEQLFNDLNAEAEQLTEELNANAISDSYIHEWEQFAESVRTSIDDASFEQRREVIEGLNVTGTIALEAGIKVLYLHLYTHSERIELRSLSFVKYAPRCAECKSQMLTFRIVLR